MPQPRYPHHIRRVDNPHRRDHSWKVEVQRQGKMTIRRFSDGRYGGKRQALKAAMHFRDALLARMEKRRYRSKGPAKPKPRRLHHIQRLDIAKFVHAWLVQAKRHGETPVRRRFSDSRHGGKRAALLAAIRFRDTVLTEARRQRYWLWRRHRLRSDNTSGSIGVARYVSHKTVKERTYKHTAWQAFWNDADGKRYTREFSVNRYGEDGAKALARRARAEGIRTLREACKERSGAKLPIRRPI